MLIDRNKNARGVFGEGFIGKGDAVTTQCSTEERRGCPFADEKKIIRQIIHRHTETYFDRSNPDLPA